MALVERVTPEQAAVVFRRAAELQAGRWHGEDAVLDDAALEEIGREVGLAPDSIRAALAELRDESFAFGPTVTWGTVVRSRTIAGSRSAVMVFLDDDARDNLLTVVRRVGATTVWAPPTGAAAMMVRGLRGRRRYPLLALKELRATVSDAPGGLVRVCLEGSLRFPTRLLSGRTQLASIAAIGGGAAIAFGIGGAGSGDWILDASGAVLSVFGAGIGLRDYRRGVARAELALGGLLERLNYGVRAAPPWPLPRD
jgi:hypothetical protein